MATKQNMVQVRAKHSIESLRIRLAKTMPKATKAQRTEVERAVLAWALSTFDCTVAQETALLASAGCAFIEGPMGEVTIQPCSN